MMLAQEYELTYGVISPTNASNIAVMSPEKEPTAKDLLVLQPTPRSGFKFDPTQGPSDAEDNGPRYYEKDWNQESPSIVPIPVPFDGIGISPRAAPYHQPGAMTSVASHPAPSQFTPITEMQPSGATGPTAIFGYYDPMSPDVKQQPYTSGAFSYTDGHESYTGGPASYTESYAVGSEWYTGEPQSYAEGPQSFAEGPPSSYSVGPQSYTGGPPSSYASGSVGQESFQREVEEEGAFVDSSAP